MSKTERRIFSREFRLKVVERLEAGESGTALALALSVKSGRSFIAGETLRALAGRRVGDRYRVPLTSPLRPAQPGRAVLIKLKYSRRLATRYDKTADSYTGFILIASARTSSTEPSMRRAAVNRAPRPETAPAQYLHR
jgi:hypothetical protein